MTVLTEIPPVLEPGMWTMHPSVRNETGTPSNQLLGENLVSEGCYFWKQHSFLSLMSPHYRTFISLADTSINI